MKSNMKITTYRIRDRRMWTSTRVAQAIPRAGRLILFVIMALCAPQRLHSFATLPLPFGGPAKVVQSRHSSFLVNQPPHVALPISSSSSFSSISSRDDTSKNETYDFWEGRLSHMSFNMDLHNLAMEDPFKAQDALEIMKIMYEKNPDHLGTINPDATCYSTVIDGFVQFKNPSAAQAILDTMERIVDETGSNLTAPNDLAHMMVAQSWADDARNDFTGASADRAELVMRRMQERGLPANVKVWSVVMEGWCKRSGLARMAMTRAEKILREMEQSSEHDGKVPKPNIITYTSFIGGLARSRDRDLARKAEATLVRMQEFGIVPDVVAYTSVISCWSKAVSRRERELAASRVLRILAEMEKKYSRGEYIAKPSLITYSAAIRAIGNSLDPSAPQLAEEVLQRMYKLQETEVIANMKPNTATYNAVLDAISRAQGPSKVRYARRAEQILADMEQRAKNGERDVKPDVRTWAAVLRSWAKSRDPNAAENAQRLLDKMEVLYEKGETNVRPNYVCYTTVMGAWSHSKRKDALDMLDAILKKMEQGYEDTLDVNLRPNTVSYVTAIDAYVRNDEFNAARRAQATVERLLKLHAKGLGHVRPTRIVLNTLIHAWSKSKEKNAAKKAERIFQQMEAQYRAGDELVRPDEVSLCAVLNAWANVAQYGGAERAQQIFEHMQSLSLEERGFHLSIMMPNIVIKAIARSGDSRAVEKAEKILLKLENDYIFGKSTLRPDVTTFSSVINSCAYYRHSEGREQALEVALRTFQKLCEVEDDHPNNITYGTLFKAIASLKPVGEDREKLVRKLFDQCCDEGFVDAFVLGQVRKASPELYRDLVSEPCGLGSGRPDANNEGVDSILKNMPREWCENVIE